MKVLLTGGSGFLGTIIKERLKNCLVTTLGRMNADIIADLTEKPPSLSYNTLVIHAAGKAHTKPRSEQEIKEIFKINVEGTHNLLNALSLCGIPKYFVFISSVSVYGLSSGSLINENNPLLAVDPYGLSKIHAEKIIQNWAEKNNIICTILRLPLIIGKNAPGNLGAMIKGIKNGYYTNIAGGNARKSMVMADDVADFIIPISETGGIYNLTDGYHPNFKELSNHIARQLGKRQSLSIPKWMAQTMAKVGDVMFEKFPFNSDKLIKITSELTFDDSKARTMVNWDPKYVLETFKL